MIASDRGLVLRTLALGETSKIVSILGRESGKLRLVARGVRAPRSRAGACLEVGNEIEFVFSQRPGSDLGMLRETSLVRAWLAAVRRMETLGVSWAVLELLERVIPDGAPEGGLLDDAWCCFEALGHCGDRSGTLLLFYAFELRLLERLGLRPALASCGICGTPPAGAVYLDVQAAGFTCRTCRVASPAELRLPAPVAATLLHLLEQPWEVANLETRAHTRRAVGIALHQLLGAHVERYRYPVSLRLLKKVDTFPTSDSASSGMSRTLR